MGLIDSIKENARKELRTIVLPESEDERVLQATEQVLNDKTANVILMVTKIPLKQMQHLVEQTLKVHKSLTQNHSTILTLMLMNWLS